MSDLISRQSLKQKLQKHHDFFVDAYGGFSNLPQNDKSRVDEITNCIAMVVNEPSVTIPSVENKYFEGMTNGEVLQKIILGLEPIVLSNETGAIYFDWEWWYAPYKAESEGKAE